MDSRERGTSMPEPLREALREHNDGAELERVWQLLPVAEQSITADDVRSSASRDEMWARIVAETVEPETAEPETTATPVARTAPIPVNTPTRTTTPVVSLDAHRVQRRRVMRSTILAAAALLTVSLGWSMRDITTSTEAGQTMQLTLADGSQVTMRGGSTLQHPRWIRPTWLGGGTRDVRLRGVAFFDVAKDADRPFILETAQARIRVVGTRFNVSTLDAGENPSTDVAVDEGIVEVRRTADADAPVTLNANDRVRVRGRDASALTVTRGADVSRETAWIRGGFSAVDLPFNVIIGMLESQFGVEITLSGSAVSNEAMTIYYPTQGAIDAILLDLCTMRGLLMRRTSRGFEISSK